MTGRNSKIKTPIDHPVRCSAEPGEPCDSRKLKLMCQEAPDMVAAKPAGIKQVKLI